MPSKLEYFTFPRLKSAKREIDDGFKAYKSGASFTGHLEEGIKKVGYGTFVWPKGDRYTGEFADNVRVGKGVQEWADGSKYDGEFLRDMRHGFGEATWNDGEGYKGNYFKDRRHGFGTYIWPDGATYTGTFYCDKKEGYGTFLLSNGDKFEGLYKDDEREGPGILTYKDGRQDVGVWHKERLVKLCTAIGDIFTMAEHLEFDYDPQEHIKKIYIKDELKKERQIVLNSVREEFQVTDLRAQLESLSVQDLKEFSAFQPSMGCSVDLHTLTYDKVEYDDVFYGENETNGSDDDDEVDNDADNGVITALNNTPSHMDMQRHMYKHKGRQHTVTFDVNQILKGDRDGFGPKGPIELASETFIHAACCGDHKTVYSLLSEGEVDVNVADKDGNTALLATAVNMHKDVINCLLDHGADVNKLSDEGVSAVAACHVFFYPITSFLYNIAERYLDPPVEDEEGENHKGEEEEEEEKRPIHGKEDVNGYNDEEIEKEIANELEKHNGVDHDLESTASEEFESNASVRNYGIAVTEQLLERSATALSTNRRIVSGRTSKCTEPDLGTARIMAVQKAEHVNMEATIRLLLRRGADPNASSVPMPVVFFAIKAADVDAVRVLLEKGAATSSCLSDDKDGLAPTHIAAAIPGEEGVEIMRLLLQAGADPNVRAHEEELEDKEEDIPHGTPAKMKPGLDDSVSLLSLELEERGDNVGGRTPLHIACHRDDNHKLAQQVVHLLLEHGANPNVLCNGQSPLSLAIGSGNDLAIDELLSHNANPSLPLGHGIGSALCAASNTAFEHRREPQQRIGLIDKLIQAGANILAPIYVGSKKQLGTAVDYAYWMFNLDRRIAHMPYHALTHAERDTYNARRKLLGHMGDLLREAAVRREQERLEAEEQDGRRSVSPSPNFVYTGAGAKVPDSAVRPKSKKTKRTSGTGEVQDGKQVVFHNVAKDSLGQEYPLLDKEDDIYVRKPLFKYCYECGRSIGVRLSACTRCKEVYYCSKACKLKAWNARHKEECVRIAGRSRSPSPSGKGGRVVGSQPGRIDSPTPTTNPNSNAKVTVEALMGKNASNYGKGRKEVTIKGKGSNKGKLGGKGGQVMGSKGKGQYSAGGSGGSGSAVSSGFRKGGLDSSKYMDTPASREYTENYSFN
ncbi:ankyrin repeat and MYND domain-containing protein 1-like [Glandiceps talaboti]